MLPSSDHNDNLAPDEISGALVNYQWRKIVVGILEKELPKLAPGTLTEIELQEYESRIDSLIEDIYSIESTNGVTIVAVNKQHKFSVNQTSTSSTLVDVDPTNAAISGNLNGGTALVQFIGKFFKFTNANGFFAITDGTTTSPEVQILGESTPERLNIVSHIFTNVPIGNTTYKLQFRSDNGQNVAVAAKEELQMILLEIS